jgi:hypothetical protein
VPRDVSNNIELRLGSLSPAIPQFLSGRLDEVKVRRRALSASEVAAEAPTSSPVAQTITFDPLPDRTFGDPPFTVTATASSGLPVSFAATGSCAVVGGAMTLSGAGSCTVTATQDGDLTYAPAPP